MRTVCSILNLLRSTTTFSSATVSRFFSVKEKLKFPQKYLSDFYTRDRTLSIAVVNILILFCFGVLIDFITYHHLNIPNPVSLNIYKHNVLYQCDPLHRFLYRYFAQVHYIYLKRKYLNHRFAYKLLHYKY